MDNFRQCGQEGLTEKMAPEPGPGGAEGGLQMWLIYFGGWGWDIPGRTNNRCKGSEVGAGFTCLRTCKEVIAGAETTESKVHEVRQRRVGTKALMASGRILSFVSGWERKPLGKIK